MGPSSHSLLIWNCKTPPPHLCILGHKAVNDYDFIWTSSAKQRRLASVEYLLHIIGLFDWSLQSEIPQNNAMSPVKVTKKWTLPRQCHTTRCVFYAIYKVKFIVYIHVPVVSILCLQTPLPISTKIKYVVIIIRLFMICNQ